jgi:sirohydrochlorin cobaltochelatase
MLILLAHGSRDARWRGSIETLAQAVQARSSSQPVRVAFMQFEGPTLAEVIQDGVAEGHRSFQLLPLFMASAGHVDKDIKPLVNELAVEHPHVDLRLMTPVGEDDLFPGLIIDIITRPFGQS